MEHYNPLLENKSSHKFITIGEIMLRLTPPNYQKIRMADLPMELLGTTEKKVESMPRLARARAMLASLPP